MKNPGSVPKPTTWSRIGGGTPPPQSEFSDLELNRSTHEKRKKAKKRKEKKAAPESHPGVRLSL
jgi:hypothetical protein